ncbi:MAG TPA: alpha/beta hydrolase, partial [Solirubrobacteraceae bacterium]|nr:alpha/beta hydrolase [Solirubrobacteraceae bacterium]
MTQTATMIQTANVNGVEMAYVEQGQGQPVVFVHGGTGDLRSWERQMEDFGSRYRTIAVSCRGYWPNRKLEPDERITLATFVDDIAGLIRALNATPAHFVGHSSPGGFGGLLLAARYPHLLRSLV